MILLTKYYLFIITALTYLFRVLNILTYLYTYTNLPTCNINYNLNYTQFNTCTYLPTFYSFKT